MRRIALFDVAGTLVEGNPWRGFLKYDGMNKLRVFGSYPLIAPPYWAKNWGLISDTRFRQIWVRQMAGLLRGMSREETNALFRWISGEFMRDHYREDVLARLKQHKQDGDYVLLVSGMFTPLTQAFADMVGADAGVGTGLGFDANGVCNGQIVGAVCAGTLKPQIARDFLNEQGIVLDEAETFGYADSYSDVALLQTADHATATYPDEKLRAEVLAHGWACME